MCVIYLIGNYLFICTIIKILGFDLVFLKNKEYNKDKEEKKKKANTWVSSPRGRKPWQATLPTGWRACDSREGSLCGGESLALQLISEVKSGFQTIPKSSSGFTELWAPFCRDMSLMNTNSSIPTVLPNLPWELPEWKDLSSVYLMLIGHRSANTAVSTKYSKFNVLSRFTLSFKLFKVRM